MRTDTLWNKVNSGEIKEKFQDGDASVSQMYSLGGVISLEKLKNVNNG
jgi:hypothetical protein